MTNMVDDVMTEPSADTNTAATSEPAEPSEAKVTEAKVTEVTPTGATPAAATPTAAPRAARMPGWLALFAAVASGGAGFAAFPLVDLWWAAPISVALLAAATFRRGFWVGSLLGFIAGLTFLIPHLSWAGGYVGTVWYILPAAEALYFALLGGLSALASPVIDRWRWSWPFVTGTLWVLQEALRDRTPFGGFPWGRLAFSQGDSPLLRLAALGGAPLVTFAVAMLGGLLVWAPLVFVSVWNHENERVRARALIPLTMVGVILVGPLTVPVTAAGDGRSVVVAIVQGNVPRLGLDFNAQRRAVLDNHVAGTLQLAAEVEAGRSPRPDFVVWPENSSDIDPIANADAKAQINLAAARIGVPILVGGLLDGPGDNVRNVGIVWEPNAEPEQFYIKRHPVPFAEYMPVRRLARMITEKADLVRADFVAGPTPGVLTLGSTTIGDVICFEVAYDSIVRDTVTGGAELLVVQTNNATFNEAEARQQMAMVRLRAVEHGRPALMASTVGVSGFVDPSGAVFDATPFNAPAVIVRELPLRSSRTMATELGVLPELALVAAALVILGTAVTLRRRRSLGVDTAQPVASVEPSADREVEG